MSTHFTRSVARIRGTDDKVVGTGFAALGRYVVTCAHVVDDALGRTRGTVGQPGVEVRIDLPFLSKFGLQARVAVWYPTLPLPNLEHDPRADIAVLDLGDGVELAASVRPEMVDRRVPAMGTRFLTFGYPRGYDNGAQADGEILAQDSGHWLHLRDTQAFGHFIKPGFSGAGVFSVPGPREPRLIGLVTAADTDEAKRLAFVVPSHLLCRAWPPLARPYRGLARFDEEEADLFFGRSAFVEELYGKLQRSAFATVVGPSGSGKSSVVMAGLVPRLREEGWSVAECRPGRDPVYELCYGLAPLLGADIHDPDARMKQAKSLSDTLRSDPGSILDLARKIGAIRGGRLLVFIDQFEELFTNDAGAPDGGEAKKVETTDDYGSPRQAAFLKVLEAIAAQDSVGRLPIRAVATLRADFMAQALRIGVLARLLRDADVKLGPMSAVELSEAIRAPAAKFGVTFEEGLAEEVVAEMKGRPGGLPLLQFALDRLWRRQADRQLTLRAYRGEDGRGGLETALNDHAEAVLARLGPGAEAGLRRVMLRLVRLGTAGTPDARAVATRAEIGEADWELVQRLAQEEVWLVTIGTDAGSGAETAEVMHEALIGAWGRLRGWLNEFRAFGLWRQRLQVDLDRHAQGATSDTLLRGSTLAEAEGKLASDGDKLNPREVQFITDSRDHAKREAETALEEANERARLANDLAMIRGVALIQAKEASASQKRANLRLRVALALFVAVAGVAGSFYVQADRQTKIAEEAAAAEEDAREEAEAAAAEADAQRIAAVTNETQALTALSQVAVSEGRPTEAVKLGLAAWPRSNGDLRPQFETAIQGVSDGLSQGRLPRRILAHDDYVTGALELSDGRILSWSRDSTLRLWDPATGAQIGPPMNHDGSVWGAMELSDGRILSWSDDNTLRLWDPATGAQIGQSMEQDNTATGALELSGGRILSWSWNKTLRLWNPATGAQIGPLMNHDGSVRGAMELSDSRILSWSEDTTLRLWDPATGTQIGPPMKHDGPVEGALELSDGRILSWSDDSSLRLWDPATGAQIGPLMAHDSPVKGAMELSGGRILSWSKDNSLRLWDPATGAQIGPLMNHDGSVRGAMELSDSRILSWSEDTTLRLWDPATGTQIGPPMKHDGPVEGALELSDGRILSWSDDSSLRLWDPATGAQIGPKMVHDGPINGALAIADGRILSWAWVARADGGILYLSADNTLWLWDHATGAQIGLPMRHDEMVIGALELLDRRILSWSTDSTLWLWDPATGAQIGTTMEHDYYVEGALELSDGRILSWSWDNTLRLWNAETGAQIGPSMQHDRTVMGALELSGGRILSWSDDWTLRLWSPATGAQIGPLMNHDGSVWGAMELSDSRILSWSEDTTLRLWDPATGTQIGPPMKHDGPVEGALELSDGRILSWSNDTTQRLWDPATGAQMGPPMRHDGLVRGAMVLSGGRILSWSEDNTLRLWDPATGAQIGPSMEHDNTVTGALELSGGRILSWSEDNSLRLWDPATGTQIGPPMWHDDVVWGALELTGGRILSWSEDNTLRLWDPATGAQIGPPMKHGGAVRGALELTGDRILSWSEDWTLQVWSVTWPKGTIFQIACALLPDSGFDDVTSRYGVTIGEPICADPGSIPLPDWNAIRRAP